MLNKDEAKKRKADEAASTARSADLYSLFCVHIIIDSSCGGYYCVVLSCGQVSRSLEIVQAAQFISFQMKPDTAHL